jgi:hypothetical protein
MFDPRNAYHRRMWHYESGTPLSVAQLIALGSLDAATAALLWLLIGHHESLTVSGPTDPTPGVGKTTTLNALLGFLPGGSNLVYTVGMYEEFEFTSQVEAELTCVLANEVSNHLPIYMWGRVARRLLKLPEQGFAIATSCHADTVQDVLAMLSDDLKVPPNDIRRLGIIINIGLVGRLWPPRRRFLTVNFIRPSSGSASQGSAIELIPLVTWDLTTDSFLPPGHDALLEIASALSMPAEELVQELERRTEIMLTLSEGNGAGMQAMRRVTDAYLTASVADQESSQGGKRQLVWKLLLPYGELQGDFHVYSWVQPGVICATGTESTWWRLVIETSIILPAPSVLPRSVRPSPTEKSARLSATATISSATGISAGWRK